jgi:hypothetical protein
MKITIESTARVVTLNGVIPARVWQGATEAGVPVVCFLTRISPQTDDPAAIAVFDAELSACAAPSPEIEAIPLRLIL